MEPYSCESALQLGKELNVEQFKLFSDQHLPEGHLAVHVAGWETLLLCT